MSSETTIRLGVFLCVFSLVAVLEVLLPRRARTQPRFRRWLTNLSLVALNPISVRLLFPIIPVGLAAVADERNWGLFNNVSSPYWLGVGMSVLALDFAVYIQHVLHHAIPLLWRFHMVHHSDLDYDLTTGVRFHPIEILISMGVKLGAVIVLGAPVLAVIVFESALNAFSMFNHSNIHLPLGLDRAIRFLAVTPDMHRVHHSVEIRETNSNYGFCFPWWDRLLGTYKDQPELGHLGMTIGLSQFRDEHRLTLLRLLALPFHCDPGSVPINRALSG